MFLVFMYTEIILLDIQLKLIIIESACFRYFYLSFRKKGHVNIHNDHRLAVISKESFIFAISSISFKFI